MAERAVPAQTLLDRTYAESVGPIDAALPSHFAAALTAHVRRQKPRLAVEIGMANGLSTLAILAGLPPGGRLISIDPFQHEQWHGNGLKLVAQCDRATDHTLCERFDYLALPDLVQAGESVDFAYVDGMHTFDYVALDAFYIDKLLSVEGVVAFNDCGFRSIHKYLRFLVSHRHYEELDVGLARDYRGRNPAVTIVRWLSGRSNQDRYFRKLDRWEPEHNFFRDF